MVLGKYLVVGYLEAQGNYNQAGTVAIRKL